MTRKRIAWAALVLPAGLLPILCCLLVAAPAAPRAEAAASQPTSQNVLLISWDGMDRTVLKEMLDANRLPNVAAIIRDGSLQEIEVRGHGTETMPGHAEMLTGLAAQTTGVITNHRYQPIPEGLTIFERVQKQLGMDNVRTIMAASKADKLGGRGPGESPDGPKGEPYFLAKKHLDVYDAHDRSAGETGPLFLKYMARLKPPAGAAWPRFLAFVHFSDPDAAGHAHGAASAEYRLAAIACDQAVGAFVAWLKKEKLYDRTFIYVTADHGFDRNAKSHYNAPHVWLATNDKAVTKGGTLADVPATILERFGVDLTKLEPKLIGAPLTKPAAVPASRPSR